MWTDGFLITVLRLFGTPDWIYEYFSPTNVLLMVIFSTQIVTVIIGTILWFFIRLFAGGKKADQKFKNKNYKKEKGRKKNKNDKGVSVHSYNMDDMHKMYNMDQKRSLFSVVVFGFAFPLILLCFAVYVALSMSK